MLPLWCINGLIAQGAVKRLCEGWRAPGIAFSLAYAPGRSRSPRVASLIAFFRSELEKDGGPGIAFIREMGATDSVTTPDQPRAR